ncbi:MAG: hypothetical protein HC782_03080 [Gammaproteobacteria bacterium]|nr:hypothetical protein [Gammaproteobacteria bacterium]
MSELTPTSVISMTLNDCARVLGAQLHIPNPTIHAAFEGVSTDSRRIDSGQLFVALCGEHFDGHEYVAAAASRGAVAAIVAHKVDVAIAQIIVGDTMWAYGCLAQHWRSRFSYPSLLSPAVTARQR